MYTLTYLRGRGRTYRGQADTDILALKQESWIIRYCFSFSSQYLSTEQEEKRRPQTGQKDSADLLTPAIFDNPTLLL